MRQDFVGDEFPRIGDTFRFTQDESLRAIFRGKTLTIKQYLDADGNNFTWDPADRIPRSVLVSMPEVKLSRSRTYIIAYAKFLASARLVELVNHGGGLDALFSEFGSAVYLDSSLLEDDEE